MYVTYNYRTSAYTIAMAIRRPGCRRKLKFAVIFKFMFVIIVHATPDADEAAVFAKDVIEDDDDWKTGPRFFKKEEKHQLPYSSP